MELLPNTVLKTVVFLLERLNFSIKLYFVATVLKISKFSMILCAYCEVNPWSPIRINALDRANGVCDIVT